MRNFIPWKYLIATVALACFVGGCNSQPANSGDGSPAAAGDHGDAHDDEHEGPHHGHVIELGRDHEYHAELLDDEAQKSVTVYILDKDLKELAIDAASITMNLTVDGEPKTFELGATVTGADVRAASRFDATDNELFEALHVHEATGKINVTIGGTPYSGSVEHHDHGHDDHGHDDHGGHDEHDGHDEHEHDDDHK